MLTLKRDDRSSGLDDADGLSGANAPVALGHHRSSATPFTTVGAPIPLAPADFVHLEMPDNHIASIVRTESTPDTQALIGALQSEANAHGALRSYLTRGPNPVWVELKGFSVQQNIKTVERDKDAAATGFEADVQAMGQSIEDSTRPPWRLRIVRLPDATCALVFVWHHAMVDAIRFIDLLSRLNTRASTVYDSRPEAGVPCEASAWHHGQRAPGGLGRYLAALAAWAACCAMALMGLAFGRQNSGQPAQRGHATIALSRNEVRRATQHMGCSRETLLYAIASASITRLRQRQALRRLRSRMLMTPIRSSRLDRTPRLGNHFMPGFFGAADGLAPEHLRRLQGRVHRAKTQLGPFHQDFYHRVIVAAAQLRSSLPEALVDRIRRGWFEAFAGSCSIVPGAPSHLKIADVPVTAISLFMPLLGPAKTSAAFTTFGDHIHVAITYDKSSGLSAEAVGEELRDLEAWVKRAAVQHSGHALSGPAQELAQP
jgi:hypothetical protein